MTNSSSSSSSSITATNQWALLLGSALIAYTPLASLFTIVVYPKAPLVILVTTFAFSFLLSATCSSLFYTILNAIFQFNRSSSNSSNSNSLSTDYGNAVSTSNNNDGVLAAMIPSILFQFIFRCVFTSLYHTIERVIQTSLQQHATAAQQQQQSQGLHDEGNNANTSNDAVVVNPIDPVTTTTTPNGNHNNTNTELNKFQLVLNDGSAAMAAAVGFGGMHALVLYGTLLSSQAVHNTTGVLYQDSCPYIPSLLVSALVTNAFFLLQIFWMLLTFFGMRRRLVYTRGSTSTTLFSEDDNAPLTGTVLEETLNSRRNNPHHAKRRYTGMYFGNSRSGGNYALLWILITHTIASLITLLHRRNNGCQIVLPTLYGMVLCTAYIFYMGCGHIYILPPSSSLQLQQQQHSTVSQQRQQSTEEMAGYAQQEQEPHID
jgi:Aph-1 protein